MCNFLKNQKLTQGSSSYTNRVSLCRQITWFLLLLFFKPGVKHLLSSLFNREVSWDY